MNRFSYCYYVCVCLCVSTCKDIKKRLFLIWYFSNLRPRKPPLLQKKLSSTHPHLIIFSRRRGTKTDTLPYSFISPNFLLLHLTISSISLLYIKCVWGKNLSSCRCPYFLICFLRSFISER